MDQIDSFFIFKDACFTCWWYAVRYKYALRCTLLTTHSSLIYHQSYLLNTTVIKRKHLKLAYLVPRNAHST